MRRGRLLLALCFGAGVTLVQFVAVGALNDASMPIQADPGADKTPPPVIVAPPPQPTTKPPQVPTAMRTPASKPRATAARIEASALPALKASQMNLGLLTMLPDLGEVGLGTVNVSDMPSEPDRPARARRTVEPIYPTSAQRNGIEGYVLLRLSIDASGRVKDVLVVDSEPIGVFERSAREAARRFEFVPARVSGATVPAALEKKIVFTLQ